MTNIAFLGLGKMGVGMAARLIAAGHDVTVYNRSPDKSQPLAKLGARIARSAREACSNVAAVISMVADDAASREIWMGQDGILSAELAHGTLAIECSTLSYAWVLELAQAAAARGLRYIDSPVTGLPDAAAAGALTLLVGAQEPDLEAGRPLLAVLSNRIIHFGNVGAGTTYKLIVNMLGAVQIASAAEAFALAERAGLDLAQTVDALSNGQAASPQVVRNLKRMLAGDHDRNVAFTPSLRLKDVKYALQLASALEMAVPFAALAAQTFSELVSSGHEYVNESAVVDIARARRMS